MIIDNNDDDDLEFHSLLPSPLFPPFPFFSLSRMLVVCTFRWGVMTTIASIARCILPLSSSFIHSRNDEREKQRREPGNEKYEEEERSAQIKVFIDSENLIYTRWCRLHCISSREQRAGTIITQKTSFAVEISSHHYLHQQQQKYYIHMHTCICEWFALCLYVMYVSLCA